MLDIETTSAPAEAARYDYVDARFGGKDITFKIARNDLDAFEVYAGEPAYRLMRTVLAGAWTVAQLKAVLDFASMTAKELYTCRLFARAGLASGTPLSAAARQKRTNADAVLAVQPPARYVSLVVAILAAALVGITAEEARFSDGT